MRFSTVALSVCALLCLEQRLAIAQQDSIYARAATAKPAAGTAPKFSYILFYRQNNAPTQAMAERLKAVVAKRSQEATMSFVNVADSANSTIVNKFQVGRAPMPLVLCVAPNGAVTGAINRPVADEVIERLIVTRAMADVLKALQAKKIVVLHVSADEQTPLPAAAAQFVADPMFKERTVVVPVSANDAAEASFITNLAINPAEANSSMLVVFAPPAVVVGNFPASATAAQIAAALHAAGKCCEDPNCARNQQGK
jgi:hypothetical protein